MKKLLTALLIITLIIFSTNKCYAIYDPTSLANNRFGIHILFPSEIEGAVKLANSNGGDWGYVTIPLQENDLDLAKWQGFMDNARKLHMIPIIRIATQLDLLNSSVWQKPSYLDVIDSANFLNSLNWPTKNRYVVIYNEVNRADEWGGSPNASEYADILNFATDAFHQRNPDFFVISAGLDNAAPDSPGSFINEYTFISEMASEFPDIFNKVDGISSHSYPNPGFSSSPEDNTPMSIHSFLFERDLVESYSSKTLPIFITETGWDKEKVNEQTQSNYYKEAFTNVWNDQNLIAVTPFILTAETGAFPKFSFTSENGQKTDEYNAYQSLSKTKGAPFLSKNKTTVNKKRVELPIKDFASTLQDKIIERRRAARDVLKFLIGL